MAVDGEVVSTLPTVNWVLFGSGESNKEWDILSLYLQLVCRRTWPFLVEKACNDANSNEGLPRCICSHVLMHSDAATVSHKGRLKHHEASAWQNAVKGQGVAHLAARAL